MVGCGMLRLLAPMLVVLLMSGCGDAPTPAPVTTPTPATKAALPATAATAATAATPATPATPAVPGANDPGCGPAFVYLNVVRSEPTGTADMLMAVRAAYRNTALQELVKQSDAATARQDDAAISSALAEEGPGAAITAKYAIHGALAQWMRQNLKTAAESSDHTAREAAWTMARCVWAQHLRHLGLPLVNRSPGTGELALDDATVVEVIDTSFTQGATAVAADPTDDRTLLPARQTIEKTWYRLVHRELIHHAALAHKNGDPLAARRARGLFEMLRDRLADKNTPGITTVTTMLTGPAADIDPKALVREVDVALVKRARKYCSEAVDPKLANTAAGLASVAEGAAYTRVLMPGMRALPDFDASAHMAAWQSFAEAVDAGDEAVELKRLSDELVQWNCAYQQALGIRECTATVDEIAAPAKKAG